MRQPRANGRAIAIVDTRTSGATKDRILDAAEALFMEHGFEATSLRALTAAAGVNLAAVNYHFGTKEELFQAVLTRRLDPMNQERLELLTRLEAKAAPRPLSCERILTALFIPALRLARDPERGGKNFLRLLGRAYADPAPFIRQFLSEQYARDDRALQGRVRARAAAPAAQGAVVAAAFHHGRAVVHAGRHRRAEAHRRAESARDDERRDPAAPARAVPARGPRPRRCPICERRRRASSTTSCALHG